MGVNEVLYGLMSESDRLSELTKLVGRLRFAVDGSDEGLIEEAEAEIHTIAKYLPKNHGISELVKAVKTPGTRGTELAEFYLTRCYHLVQEEYGQVARIEEKIRAIEGDKDTG